MGELESDDPTARPLSAPSERVFPPELVSVLRERLPSSHGSLAGVGDEALALLLTTIFFAGMATNEGRYYPVKVAFAGHIGADVLMPLGEATHASPVLLYRWSTLHIDPHRAFSIAELVRLGVATCGDGLYTKVACTPRGLRVVGLAREGANREGDPYVKIAAPRPGAMSIQCGHRSIIEYEHGRLRTPRDGAALATGLVRRALENAARKGEVGDASLTDYLRTVQSIVLAMAAHGKGGILVVGGDADSGVCAGPSYRTREGSSFAQLFHYLDGAAGARRAAASSTDDSRGGAASQLRRVLRAAFQRETERRVAEFAGFTAMDGATVLDSALGLRGFGVVLRVMRELDIVQASDAEARDVAPYALGRRGARHRAGATYAAKHRCSVVFVASQDGPVSCMIGDESTNRVIVWRCGPGQFLT